MSHKRERGYQADFFHLMVSTSLVDNKPLTLISRPDHLPNATLSYLHKTQGFVSLAIRENLVPHVNEADLDNLSIALGWYEENEWMFDEGDNVFVLNHDHHPAVVENLHTLRGIHEMSRSILEKKTSEEEGEEKWVAYYSEESGLIQDLRWVLADSLLQLKKYPYASGVKEDVNSSTASLALFERFFRWGESMEKSDLLIAKDYLTRHLYMKYVARILSRYENAE